jgi:hypothetical protein
MGNRIKEEHFDSTGSLQKQRSRVINGLNQLQKDIGGTDPANQIAQYAYDRTIADYCGLLGSAPSKPNPRNPVSRNPIRPTFTNSP